MNRCPNSSYNIENCPYALSSNSPLPCFASPGQCENYRAKITECQQQGIDPFRPACPTTTMIVKQVKDEPTKIKVKVDNLLYGVEVDEE